MRLLGDLRAAHLKGAALQRGTIGVVGAVAVAAADAVALGLIYRPATRIGAGLPDVRQVLVPSYAALALGQQ